MRPTRWTRRRLAAVAGGVVVIIAGLAVAAFALAGSADVVVYNGRSQYGDEQAFKAFEEQTGLDVELRGGTAPELYERLRREGDATDADLLVTTDLANLWRAEEAGLLEPVRQSYLHKSIPSSERATLVSFDSLTGSLGSIGWQVGLGYLSQRRSVPAGFVVGGLAMLLALPLFLRLRALKQPADTLTGE